MKGKKQAEKKKRQKNIKHINDYIKRIFNNDKVKSDKSAEVLK